MKRLKSTRASKPQTVRLDPDALRIVQLFTSTCDWSASSVVNNLVVVAYNSMRGHPAQAELFQARVDAAVKLYAQRKINAALEADLRRVERDAKSKIRPPHLTELHATRPGKVTKLLTSPKQPGNTPATDQVQPRS